MIENLAKNMITIKDTSFSEIIDFLDVCEKVGKKIKKIYYFLFIYIFSAHKSIRLG